MSKTAQAALIDPLSGLEPSQETGLNSHFGSTFAPAPTKNATSSSTPPRTSLSSNNPFREGSPSQSSPVAKSGAVSSERPLSKEGFPAYRAEAFGDYRDAPRQRTGSNPHPPPTYSDATAKGSSPTHGHRRRTSSLKERYPGDSTTHPLDMIRKDSKKAHRSPHLKKHHQPGADLIDRLDPAIGGRSYHHEGPYDAALLARNTSYENSPLAALQTSNQEALKATPKENIKDAVERHKPLDGVAIVPPGMPDRMGRTYEYEEGADLMHEDNADGPGYKRWPGKDYLPEDLKGESEPAFSLDHAMKTHKINDEGIEMAEGSSLTHNKPRRSGSDGKRASVEVAHARDSDEGSHGLRAGLKKRIGSLRKKNRDD